MIVCLFTQCTCIYTCMCVCLCSTGIFEDDFIEERMKGLEEFINK